MTPQVSGTMNDYMPKSGMNVAIDNGKKEQVGSAYQHNAGTVKHRYIKTTMLNGVYAAHATVHKAKIRR